MQKRGGSRSRAAIRSLVMGSATKGARQPEAAENAAVDKVGNRRDAVARESQHEHSDGVRDRCLRVGAIAAECWLAVGSGWDQLVAAPAPPIYLFVDRRAARVFERGRRHREPRVFGE